MPNKGSWHEATYWSADVIRELLLCRLLELSLSPRLCVSLLLRQTLHVAEVLELVGCERELLALLGVRAATQSAAYNTRSIQG